MGLRFMERYMRKFDLPTSGSLTCGFLSSLPARGLGSSTVSSKTVGFGGKLCADWPSFDRSQRQRCPFNRPDMAVPIAAVLRLEDHLLKIW